MVETKQKTINNEIVLQCLLENAFDFLERGIEQFEHEPKYSVINFCSAVELFLKARLLKEHWALVVAKNPKMDEFLKGDFKSINFVDLIPAIKNITNENIHPDAQKCFANLATHRNKMVHFYHAITNSDSTTDDIEKIVIEQCRVWIHLKQLFATWNFIFSKYANKIDNLDKEMQKANRQKYLQAKFEKLKDEINRKQKKGSIFINCPTCSYLSMLEENVSENIYKGHCWVCDKKMTLLKINCPECDNEIIVNENNIEQDSILCENCKHILTKDDLSNIMDSNPPTKDNYFEKFPINCSYCGGYHSVVEHNDKYICLNCLEYDDNIEYCEWCSEGQLGGDLEYSFEAGCEFCEGHAGWHNNYEDE